MIAKQAAAEAARPAAAADRLAFNAGTGRVVQGGGDLIDAIKAGTVKLEDVKKEDLPPEMQTMTPDQRKAYVKEQIEKREKLQSRVADLLKQRQAYIDDQTKKLAEAGKGDAFDAKVAEMIRAQAQRKGIRYGE